MTPIIIDPSEPGGIADPTLSIAAYLIATVGDQCDNNVFRPAIPKTFISQMPVACIVVRAAGGYAMFGRGQLPVGDPRIDAICYGSTPLESQNLARGVVVALKALQREIWEGALIHWARISAGPLPAIDEDTLWNYTLVSAQVMHSELTES